MSTDYQPDDVSPGRYPHLSRKKGNKSVGKDAAQPKKNNKIKQEPVEGKRPYYLTSGSDKGLYVTSYLI